MLPQAQIVHRTAQRLRIRIPGRRGERDFFARLEGSLKRDLELQEVRTNSLTGTVLLIGERIDVERLAELARGEGLFVLQGSAPPAPLSKKLVRPMANLDESIRTISGGELDLPSLFFLGLLGMGIYQIARGNVGAPPWYTAFWYAFGVFTKYLIDKGYQSDITAN